ncbi:MAG: glycosyltransferase, partial [Eggerthellaceae bacterium]|nr:glycosyltransferase [Eggerthellaceae bacterium]
DFVRGPHAYDLIYAEIPPNDVAKEAGMVAHKYGIPFVVDINDLWPEAMRMAIDIPIVSDVAFSPFAMDAKRVYRLLDAAVGTSEEYSLRPRKDRDEDYERITVYVGNDISEFDAGAAHFSESIDKPSDEFWLTYTGTLGKSYDLDTLIKASSLIKAREAAEGSDGSTKRLAVKILGDGPEKERLEGLARQSGAPVEFVGYLPYEEMAAWLDASDATINSLIKSAPQSIVTKVGDYLAAGKPMINTGSSVEFRKKVEDEEFGINVEAEDPRLLADAIEEIMVDAEGRARMGRAARRVAEEQFDRPNSYMAIVDLIRDLV